eukprot:tig00000237_g20500.t1
MPTTSATIVKTVSAGSIVPISTATLGTWPTQDGQGGVGRKLRHPAHREGPESRHVARHLQRFRESASCSVYVYFDIDSGVSADEAEALWLSGLLKKIEPLCLIGPPFACSTQVHRNTALTRKFGNGANPNIKTHLDGALIDATHKTTQAVPFEMYNLWKMTAKEMMTNATTGGASVPIIHTAPRIPVPRSGPGSSSQIHFQLYNNIAGMPTSGMVVGSTSWPN